MIKKHRQPRDIKKKTKLYINVLRDRTKKNNSKAKKRQAKKGGDWLQISKSIFIVIQQTPFSISSSFNNKKNKRANHNHNHLLK